MTNKEKWKEEADKKWNKKYPPDGIIKKLMGYGEFIEGYLQASQDMQEEIDHLNLMLQTEREESERWMKKEEILRIRVRELVSLLSCQGRGPNK